MAYANCKECKGRNKMYCPTCYYEYGKILDKYFKDKTNNKKGAIQ